ncbi:hypothetical protein J3F84DRAFT_364802, partial [Trichoderma pleuroticola]
MQIRIHAHRIEIGISKQVPRASARTYISCSAGLMYIRGKPYAYASVSVPFLFRPPHIIFIASRLLILFRVLCSAPCCVIDPCKVSSL